MNNRKCCSCNFGYNHLICTACRYMYCDICIILNHHDSTIEHYLKELDMKEYHDIIICGRCLYSFKRIYKFIEKGIINNNELISETDKFI